MSLLEIITSREIPITIQAKMMGINGGGGQFSVNHSKIFESMIHTMDQIINCNTPKNEERERKLSTL